MSTAAGGSSNMLSMNVGGVSVNYDLGQSTSAVEAQGQQFIDSSFNEDSALLQGTISGSQNFLSSFATPVLQMAQNQQQFNTTTLPSLFSTLESDNYSVGSSAVSADQSVAEASIASSNAQAQAADNSGGGFCYITTAVCETFNLPDDCATLRTLREFRDGYMQETAQRREMVRDYYITAPAIVSSIRRMGEKAAKAVFLALYRMYIGPAVMAIRAGRNDRGFELYSEMVLKLRNKRFVKVAA